MSSKAINANVLVSIIVCWREEGLKMDPKVWLNDDRYYHNIRVTERRILKYASCCKATLRKSLSIIEANGILEIRRDGRANVYDILMPIKDIETLYHNEAATRCIFGC